MTPLAMVLALALDAVLGWPDALYRRIGHPVTWIGAMVADMERRWNDPAAPEQAQRRAGMRAALAVIGAAAGAAGILTLLLPGGWAGTLATAVLAAPLLAGRGLHDHVAAVAAPLRAGDIRAARATVAMIVGRDPERLNREGIARAALESLAENASDAVVAPVFWGFLLGLPGIAAYKAVNTLDSMIGHRTPQYQDFGRFAARLDDMANWVPARLTALGFALASGRAADVWRITRRDARAHRSPNAGWPETALAASLGCRLSGPRAYARGIENQPWLNGDAPDPGPETIAAGLALYRRMLMLVALGILLLAVI